VVRKKERGVLGGGGVTEETYIRNRKSWAVRNPLLPNTHQRRRILQKVEKEITSDVTS